MTWHLKDRELEKKLNEISGGDFSKQLNEVKNLDSYKEGLYLVFGNKCLNKGFFYKVGDFRKYQIFIEYNELEEVLVYNPNAWNEYPKIKPIKQGIYRLEVKSSSVSKTEHYVAVFDFANKYWRYVYGQRRKIDTTVTSDGFVRFRPWDD